MSKQTIQMTDAQGNSLFPVSAECGNGWIRFADGTQIVTGKANVETSGEATGAAYGFFGIGSVSFVKEFAQGSEPVVITNVLENSAWWNSSAFDITAQGFKMSVGGDNKNITREVCYIAIGRWK